MIQCYLVTRCPAALLWHLASRASAAAPQHSCNRLCARNWRIKSFGLLGLRHRPRALAWRKHATAREDDEAGTCAASPIGGSAYSFCCHCSSPSSSLNPKPYINLKASPTCCFDGYHCYSLSLWTKTLPAEAQELL